MTKRLWQEARGLHCRQ